MGGERAKFGQILRAHLPCSCIHDLALEAAADASDEEAGDERVEHDCGQSIEHGIGRELAIVDLTILAKEGVNVDRGGKQLLALQDNEGNEEVGPGSQEAPYPHHRDTGGGQWE